MTSGQVSSCSDAESFLQALSADELLQSLSRVLETRPDVRESLLLALQTPGSGSLGRDAVTVPVRAVTPAGATTPLVVRQATLRDDNSPVTSFPVGRTSSVVGSIPHRPVARLRECWSMVFLTLFMGIMLVTVAISYIMSIGAGTVTWQYFFISNSIDSGWPHRIGDLGISVAFVCYLLAMFTRFLAVKKSLMDPLSARVTRGILWLNRLALVSEIWSSLGAMGVGAFNQSFNYAIHIMFAFMTFFCATLSITLHSCIDELLCYYSVPGHPLPAWPWRLVRFVFVLASFTGLIGMFYAGKGGYIEASCTYEVVMAGALFCYYATWAFGKGYIVGVEIYLEEKSLRSLTSFSTAGGSS